MIAVIDVCGNNLTSLTNAIDKLGYSYQLTHEPSALLQASHVILPGVGAAQAGMQALKDVQLIEIIHQLTQPLLGICLGMQLLLEYSEEGSVSCLNLIPGVAKRLPRLADSPIPHMGWSQLSWTKTTPLSAGITKDAYLYFVHSYALIGEENALATCQYSKKFTAIVQYKNRYGMQFHPEKSAEIGLRLLSNFLELETPC